MKFKGILLSIGIISSLSACQPDEYEMYDNTITSENIIKLELRSDHETMMPGGNSRMGFRVVAYGSEETRKLLSKEYPDSTVFSDKVSTDTFVIPSDMLPDGLIKVYDEADQALENNIFSLPSYDKNEYKFYAKAGNIRSEYKTIKIKNAADQPEYKELVIPVIFHVLLPQGNTSSQFNVTTQMLEERLARVNDIFNARVTTNPNAGNANITFRLAEVDPNRTQLEKKGLHEYRLSTEILPNSSQFNNFIKNEAVYKSLIWDNRYYLNVWIGYFNQTFTIGSSTEFLANVPPDIKRGQTPIPGVAGAPDATNFVTSYTVQTLINTPRSSVWDLGILYNTPEFVGPAVRKRNDPCEFATALAAHLGVMTPQIVAGYGGEPQNINKDGDTDYCPDTYVYVYAGNGTVYKTSYVDKKYPELSVPYFYTSFNVMESNSRRNSLTVDQVKRIRAVLDRCPSRAYYKTKVAFGE